MWTSRIISVGYRKVLTRNVVAICIYITHVTTSLAFVNIDTSIGNMFESFVTSTFKAPGSIYTFAIITTWALSSITFINIITCKFTITKKSSFTLATILLISCSRIDLDAICIFVAAKFQTCFFWKTIMSWAGIHGAKPIGPGAKPILKLRNPAPGRTRTDRAVRRSLVLKAYIQDYIDKWMILHYLSKISLLCSQGGTITCRNSFWKPP